MRTWCSSRLIRSSRIDRQHRRHAHLPSPFFGTGFVYHAGLLHFGVTCTMAFSGRWCNRPRSGSTASWFGFETEGRGIGGGMSSLVHHGLDFKGAWRDGDGIDCPRVRRPRTLAIVFPPWCSTVPSLNCCLYTSAKIYQANA